MGNDSISGGIHYVGKNSTVTVCFNRPNSFDLISLGPGTAWGELPNGLTVKGPASVSVDSQPPVTVKEGETWVG